MWCVTGASSLDGQWYAVPSHKKELDRKVEFVLHVGRGRSGGRVVSRQCRRWRALSHGGPLLGRRQFHVDELGLVPLVHV